MLSNPSDSLCSPDSDRIARLTVNVTGMLYGPCSISTCRAAPSRVLLMHCTVERSEGDCGIIPRPKPKSIFRCTSLRYPLSSPRLSSKLSLSIKKRTAVTLYTSCSGIWNNSSRLFLFVSNVVEDAPHSLFGPKFMSTFPRPETSAILPASLTNIRCRVNESGGSLHRNDCI